MDGLRLSLVIVAQNNYAVLRQTIAEADDALARLGCEYEILLPESACSKLLPCQTGELPHPPALRILPVSAEPEHGSSLRQAALAARFDLVAIIDADGSVSPTELAKLVEHASAASLVTGCRSQCPGAWWHNGVSVAYNALTRLLLNTGVKDVHSPIKLVRRADLLSILPDSRGLFAHVEMRTRARQQGLTVAEVEVSTRTDSSARLGQGVSLYAGVGMLGELLRFWWTRMLFPGEAREEHRSTSSGWAEVAGLIILLCVAALLFFMRLRAPLLEPQEVRYAEIPRQMLLRGDWVTPVLHERPYLDKPPLFYWSVMAAYHTFGVHDRTARLVPALSGLLLIVVTYLWGRSALGPRAGLIGATVLCLMPELIYRGRMLTFDILLAVWVTAALAAAHHAMNAAKLRRVWWVASALACGLGLLTKGPVALVLVAGPLLCLGWIDRRLARPGWVMTLVYLTLAVGLAAPWYALVSASQSEFALHFFWKHNVMRFLAPFDHARPAWFYIPGLVLGLLPWSLLFPGLVRMVCDRSVRTASRRPAALGVMLGVAVWMLLFFSASGCKRPTYLLPTLPPLALALGWVVYRSAPRWDDLLCRGNRQATITAVFALTGGVAVVTTALVMQVVRPDVGLFLCGAGVLAMTLLLALPCRVSWTASAAILAMTLGSGVWFLQPAYNDLFAVRAALRNQQRPADRGRAVVCYPQRYDSAGFYLPQSPVHVFGPHQHAEMFAYLRDNPGTLMLVKSGPVLDRLLASLPSELTFRSKHTRGAVLVGRMVPSTLNDQSIAAREMQPSPQPLTTSPLPSPDANVPAPR